MPEIAGHELPTPGNADSAKQRKHREQVIVIGTIALVVLTYILVMRHGSSAAVTSNGSGFAPSDVGGSTPDSNIPLPGMIAGIPGQVAALEQGNFTRQGKQISGLRRRINQMSKRINQQSKTNHRQAQKIQHLQQELHHPKAPTHPVHVTHHTRHQPQAHEKFRSVPVPMHPPQHGGKKAPPNTSIPFGALHVAK